MIAKNHPAVVAFRESIREGVVDWQVIRAGSNLLAAIDAESRRGIDSASAQAHIQEALWPYLRDGVGYEASDAVIDVLKELEKPTC